MGGWRCRKALEGYLHASPGSRGRAGGEEGGLAKRIVAGLGACRVCGKRPGDEVVVVVERRGGEQGGRVVMMIQDVVYLDEQANV